MYRVVVSGFAMPRRACHLLGGLPSLPRLGWWWLPVLIVAGMYAVFLIDGLTRYPTGSDGLTYHLPTAVMWMQQQALSLVPGDLHMSLPQNGMIIPFLLSFAKLERGITLAHLPVALLLGAVIYALTRAVGVSRKGSLAGVCLVLSIPIVVFQSFSSYIDLYAAAFWLSALLALTWVARVKDRKRRTGLLILAGLSAGLALGSKTTYLLLVPVLGIVAMAVEWIRSPGQGRSVGEAGRNLVLFALAGLVCSGFWFVRGAVQAGNPVYPLSVEIGGHRLFAGLTAADVYPDRCVIDKLGRWWDYPWREPKHNRIGYRYGVDNGFGAAFAAFAPPGLLMAMVTGCYRRPRSRVEKWRLVFLALALGAGVLLVTVFREVLRFVLPLILIAVPVAAVMLDRLMLRFPRAVLVTFTAALAVTAVVASLKPVHAFAGRLREGVWDRAGFYEVPALVDGFDPGTRILNLSRGTMNYPLLGNSLSNIVVSPAFWDGYRGAEPISAEGLYKDAIDYVFAGEPRPEAQLAGLPLELVFQGKAAPARQTSPIIRIYRVLPNEG